MVYLITYKTQEIDKTSVSNYSRHFNVCYFMIFYTYKQLSNLLYNFTVYNVDIIFFPYLIKDKSNFS